MGECRDCKFWDAVEQVAGHANCRRYPPVIAWKMGQNGIDFIDGALPTTWAQDWCGEFQHKNNTD